MVYCDITENKVLKGPDENLLKIICIGDKNSPFGNVYFQKVKNPNHLSINTRYLTDMKFFLRDAYGRNFFICRWNTHPVGSIKISSNKNI